MKFILSLFALLVLAAACVADDVILMWNRNAETNLTHYTVYYGQDPEALTDTLAVPLDSVIQYENGTYPTAIVRDLAPGKWYFYVTATNEFNLESLPSTMIDKTIIPENPEQIPWIATIRINPDGTLTIIKLLPEGITLP